MAQENAKYGRLNLMFYPGRVSNALRTPSNLNAPPDIIALTIGPIILQIDYSGQITTTRLRILVTKQHAARPFDTTHAQLHSPQCFCSPTRSLPNHKD